MEDEALGRNRDQRIRLESAEEKIITDSAT